MEIHSEIPRVERPFEPMSSCPERPSRKAFCFAVIELSFN
jgi:hypothetical protein